MIIAGIFKPDNKNYSIELKNIMKEKIKGDFVSFENKMVTIIAGKTSETVDQGKVLKTHHSLLVGKVFTKDTYKAITEERFREEKSDGKLFVNKYWGKYILFNIDDENETLTILRDPIGQLPLFYIKLDSGALLFSSEINVLHTILKKSQILIGIIFQLIYCILLLPLSRRHLIIFMNCLMAANCCWGASITTYKSQLHGTP